MKIRPLPAHDILKRLVQLKHALLIGEHDGSSTTSDDQLDAPWTAD
jgi:hypothetical protein